ncbi:hypothetical protein D9615_009422 [Tricholomella constricta]|uniref:Phosphoinositide phospholipase C n=1 Tax=Tricholomella constricta TaxID=117010 RepID=A0A8H5GYT5_9AGAR|nr:hypothetical protein D9615_009422 [Tricholomella constricta]
MMSTDTLSPSGFDVPAMLIQGTTMTKVSEKKQRRVLFQLDPDEGCLLYKSKKAGIVALETIKEIRSGPAARYYRQQFAFPEDAEARWLTIIYILEGAYKTLHILADSADVLALWDAAVRKLVAVRQGLMTGLGNVEMREAVWERQYWKRADVEGDNRLSFEEVEKLCRRLHATLSTPQLRVLFDNADTGKKGYLDFAGFQAFVKALKRRPEIEDIYNDICKANGGSFGFPAFQAFMRDTQHSPLSEDQLQAVFAKYSSTSTTTTESSSSLPAATLTLDGFSAFLVSSDNAVFSEKDRDIWQDMTRPISEYYISSSHNTYLVGHQLVGVSTIEGYIRALLHSCRSVELDIYDGDTEPVIFHGKTLTSKVSVRDVCGAIAKYAFVASPYPLLISAEVHCSVKQQDVLVEIMLEAFGEALVRAPPEGRPKIEKLPSPEDLKGKFLLKAKNLYVVAQLEALRAKKPAPAHVLEADASSSDESDDSGEGDDGGGGGIKGEIKNGFGELKEKWRRVRGKDGSRGASPLPLPSSSSSSSYSSSTPPTSTPTPQEKEKEKPKIKMSFALVSLLVYTVGVKCRGLGPNQGYAPEHIFSLSESAADKLIKRRGGAGAGDGDGDGTARELVRHTREHLVRVYPKGTRVSSTNFEPGRYWAAGAQVVAINWQTFDLGYTMNQAMFQRNGRAGYVLKPEALRRDGKEEELLGQRTEYVLEVTIISAHQLPRLRDSTGQEVVKEKSIVDPLVQVSLHVPDWNWNWTNAKESGSSSSSSTSLLPSSSTSSLSPFPASTSPSPSPSPSPSASASTRPRTTTTSTSARTRAVRNNGFNPVWQETLRLPFQVAGGGAKGGGGMEELVFVQFAVLEDDHDAEGDVPIAVYCSSLGCLAQEC